MVSDPGSILVSAEDSPAGPCPSFGEAGGRTACGVAATGTMGFDPNGIGASGFDPKGMGCAIG